ncbi:DUF4430 domain-containing protein [Herbinix luporum]|jgi:hypothetical protein|uniref:Transcobalamin-like C-terminal domain-containing protein n=1 Tax=Herbinix luporum TaxID=1679721 RepID=A0A0K8J3J7_9FIRM|nr:DUF4430 domain-containing protein [Herbinix luporum]MDI9487963.1 DUF4430 domain-containing protein [Bacillota bacterium]CUH92067.1 hypothetical protein SD1D_0515 [Herbinix luporum]HHT55985.1 DUF4430 domain-containing protein [Herbinix luporum]
MREAKYWIKVLLATLGLFVLTILLLYLYTSRSNPASPGHKEITIKVIIPDEEPQEFAISTDALTLRQALEEKELIKGSESSYGFYITEVNGRRANEQKQEWWCITKGGENVNIGIDLINIQDKDTYELTLMEGY